MRKHISDALRFRVLKRDDFTCRYCGCHPPNVILHIDHVVPISHGGTNEFSNLVTACKTCNLSKSAQLLSKDSRIYGNHHIKTVHWSRDRVVPHPDYFTIQAAVTRAHELSNWRSFATEQARIEDAAAANDACEMFGEVDPELAEGGSL